MVIYVGNINHRATEEDLSEIFSFVGKVEKIELYSDPESYKRFAFVSMPDEDEAMEAIDMLNGADFRGRALKVYKAKRQEV